MITQEDIKKLAALARIKLSDEEVVGLQKDMQNILGFVTQIQEASGSLKEGEKERVRNIWREDANPHETGVYTETILAEAPDRKGDYLRVKNILWLM